MRLSLVVAAALSLAVSEASAQETVKTKRDLHREALRMEAEAWAELGPNERRIIAERSKYIFRMNDDLIIDAYEMFSWQDLAESAIERIVDDGDEYFRYRKTEKFKAVCGYERCTASFWFRGRLLNDPSVRRSLTPADFPGQAGALEAEASRLEAEESMEHGLATASVIEAQLHRTLPMVYAADPRTVRERQSSEFGWTFFTERGRTDQGLEMEFSTGFVGSAFASPEYFSGDRASTETNDPRIDVAGFVTSPLTELGLPVNERFLLLPSAVGQHSADLDRPNDAAHQLVYYTIADLDDYRMSPRAVARAFLAGELEIDHHDLRIVKGKFRAVPVTLKRP